MGCDVVEVYGCYCCDGLVYVYGDVGVVVFGFFDDVY